MWTPYGVLLGEFIFPVFWGGVHVVQMEQLESMQTPDGLHKDSGQKIGWATTKKKCLDSTWAPGIDLDSTWNLWGRVKSSQLVVLRAEMVKESQWADDLSEIWTWGMHISSTLQCPTYSCRYPVIPMEFHWNKNGTKQTKVGILLYLSQFSSCADIYTFLFPCHFYTMFTPVHNP